MNIQFNDKTAKLYRYVRILGISGGGTDAASGCDRECWSQHKIASRCKTSWVNIEVLRLTTRPATKVKAI